MKKTAFLFISMMLLACGTVAAQQIGIADIEQGWQKTTIKVKNGGNNPSVMQLLRAFNAQWETNAANTIIATAGDNEEFVLGWEEGTSPVYVDCVDFNTAWFNHGDTADQRLETRTYQRENGHTLFAVSLEQLNPEQKAFCCFYDYNPQTQTLTPEEVPYKNLKRKWKDSSISYNLGLEYDLTVIVEEITKKGEKWYHHYGWNGTKHTFDHSGPDFYSDGESDEEEDGV